MRPESNPKTSPPRLYLNLSGESASIVCRELKGNLQLQSDGEIIALLDQNFKPIGARIVAARGVPPLSLDDLPLGMVIILHHTQKELGWMLSRLGFWVSILVPVKGRRGATHRMIDLQSKAPPVCSAMDAQRYLWELDAKRYVQQYDRSRSYENLPECMVELSHLAQAAGLSMREAQEIAIYSASVFPFS